METDKQILLKREESVLHIFRGLFQNDLILIELIRSGQYQPEALARVALNVRSGLYSLDEIGDSLREHR